MEWSNKFRKGFTFGCNSVLNELWNAIAELEQSRSAIGYGNGQKFILRQLISKMDLEAKGND